MKVLKRWLNYRVTRLLLVLLSALILTGCSEYTDEERQNVEDLVEAQSENFIRAAEKQYGDVKVTDIEGETYIRDASNVLPKTIRVAGKNLFGKVESKDGEPFDVEYDVEKDIIYSYQTYEEINQSMADELEKHGINVLAIEQLDSRSEKPMYSEDITTYKQLVDMGKAMRFRIITDTKLSEFEPSHFNDLYDDMLATDENGGYLRVKMTRVMDTSDDNVMRLMRHWKNYGMAFSKHESIYFEGDYRYGDPRLSDYKVLATLNLDDSRDGAMEYTDSNDERTVTYRTPNSDGEHIREVELMNGKD